MSESLDWKERAELHAFIYALVIRAEKGDSSAAAKLAEFAHVLLSKNLPLTRHLDEYWLGVLERLSDGERPDKALHPKRTRGRLVDPSAFLNDRDWGSRVELQIIENRKRYEADLARWKNRPRAPKPKKPTVGDAVTSIGKAVHKSPETIWAAYKRYRRWVSKVRALERIISVADSLPDSTVLK